MMWQSTKFVKRYEFICYCVLLEIKLLFCYSEEHLLTQKT